MSDTDDNDRPVPVLFIIGSLDVGGAERHLVEIARALDCKRWRSSVFTLSHKGRLSAALEAANVTVHAPNFPLILQRQSRLTRIGRLVWAAASLFVHLLCRRPRIVHFFLPGSYLLGLPLAILAGRPLRIMSRRSLSDYQGKRRLLALLERIFHFGVTVALGNSRAVVRQLAQEGLRCNQLRLIYNGIDIDVLSSPLAHAAVRQAFGIAESELVFITVANLIPYKGHADLLAALEMARPKLPAQWRLLCVGRDDGVGETLRADAERRGLTSHISWLGERDDVSDLLVSADIGLLCSHEEGFSNAVLEGCAVGLPMIVTDVGGNSEAVIHGYSGLVVPRRDPQALAHAIVELASHADTRRLIGKAARERVRARFNLQRCVAEYEALYAALIAGIRPLPGDVGLELTTDSEPPDAQRGGFGRHREPGQLSQTPSDDPLRRERSRFGAAGRRRPR